ncbi:MAG: sensor domain-containing diguanylate cyclase [Myxococcota bacterium]
MTQLVQAALTIRRALRGLLQHGPSLAFVLALLAGLTPIEWSGVTLGHTAGALLFAFWCTILILRSRAERTRGRTPQDGSSSPSGLATRAVLEFHLGLMLLVITHAVVRADETDSGAAQPVVYIAVAFLASFAQRPVGTILVAAAVAIDAGVYFIADGQRDWIPILLRSGFTVAFGLLNVVFTRAEVTRVRELSRKERVKERERAAEENRIFRLTRPISSGASDEERLFLSSLEQVHQQLYFILEQLHGALDLHTAILLFTNPDGKSLSIVELATQSDDIADGPLLAGGGAVGAVALRGITTNLEHIRPGYGGICYYRGTCAVRSFMGVPVLDGSVIRGALCVDRIEDRPFRPKDEVVLKNTIRQVLRTMENERVFVQLERGKREQSILYKASCALSAASDEHAVIDAGMEAAREIAAFDFAAVTRFDAETRRHLVLRAVGTGIDAIDGLSFKDNNSLTAMVVKNRHYLPYRGDFDPKQQFVFTRKTNPKHIQSLLILPLIVREDAIGAMVFAAEAPDRFGDSVRPTLQVLSNQIAVALSNAASVRRLEEMATTDGLTGCLNKRAFLEELESKLRSAERFQRQLSLIVTDIDHFKSVNDTYGHATGDVVIKELGALLMGIKRETDTVARFGGEEFCILCEETDGNGAALLAERARAALEATVFRTEMGALSVTASLGVANFPHDARTAEELFEASDKALYAAKHGGRNRVQEASSARAA